MYVLKSQQRFDTSCYNCIEMLGMPASGKTTMMRKLMREQREMVDVNHRLPEFYAKRQIYKSGCLLKILLSSPQMFVRDTRIIASSEQKSVKDFLTVLLNWFLIVHLYREAIRGTEKVYIWDEGLYQALWSIAFSATKRFDMLRLLEKKPVPKVVYLTDAEDKVLIARALERKSSLRLDYENKMHLQKGREALEQVMACIDSMGYCKEG